MKRALVFLILFGIILSFFPNTGSAANGAQVVSTKYGDLNGDNDVNSIDFSLMRKYLLGMTSDFPVSNGSVAGNVNGDNEVNAIDFSFMRKYLLGMISEFPVGSTIPGQPTMPPVSTPVPTKSPVPIKVPVVGGVLDASSIKTKYINVAYANVSRSQTLDIYLPNEGNGPFPVIIAIHGGAFLGGSSNGSDIAPMVENGINHGYAVVSLNYRFSTEAKFPKPMGDVKAAVRYVRANAAKYNFDTNKIAAWGDSSGGFLVSMLGTTANVSELNSDTTDNLNYSSAVNAVVDWFGHIDFLTMDEQFRASHMTSAFGDTNSTSSPASQLIGQLVTLDPVLTEKANPETYISTMTAATTPKFLIQHGSGDNIVPYQQSTNFASKLKQSIGESNVTLEIINGAGHGGPEFYTQQNLDKVMAFLDGIFK